MREPVRGDRVECRLRAGLARLLDDEESAQVLLLWPESHSAPGAFFLAAPALQRFAVTIPARANSDAPRTRPALPSVSCCSLSWTRPPRQRQRSCQRSPTYSCALPPAARWRAAPWLRARAHHRATSNTQERATTSNCTPRH